MADETKHEDEQEVKEKKKNKFGKMIEKGLSGEKVGQPGTGQRVGKNAVNLMLGEATPEQQMRVYGDTAIALAPHAIKGGTVLAKALIAAFESKSETSAEPQQQEHKESLLPALIVKPKMRR